MIIENNQKRLTNLQRLSGEPNLVTAFDAAVIHFVRMYTAIPETALGRLSLTACDQVCKGFEAVVSEDEASVMNACRIFMELTVLVEEWRLDISRMEAWLTLTPERRTEVFRFGQILDRMKTPLGIDEGFVLREKLEYAHHSQWMHAVPRDADAKEPTLAMLVEELIGHTNAIMREIARLRQSGIEQVPEIPTVPTDIMPDGWIAATEWRHDRQRAMTESLEVFGVAVNQSPILPKDADIGSLLVPLADEDQQ